MTTARKTKWTDYVNVSYPIIIACFGFVFWLGGSFESRTDREKRTKTLVAPILKRLDELEEELKEHIKIPGHIIMDQRFLRLERDIEELKKKVNN